MFFLKFCLAFLLDILIGDPHCYPHPVRGIGFIINLYEKITRKIISLNLYVAGLITVICTIITTVFCVVTLLYFTHTLSSIFAEVIAFLLLYTTISYGDLKKESMNVFSRLVQSNDLWPARKSLSRIVGRETEKLDRREIIKATVETVAENSSDGIIAPIFWAIFTSIVGYYVGFNELVCAALGGILYKTVNTMDSMLGYTNDKYIKFGFVAAKLDDFFNYIPARLTGIFLVLSSGILNLDYKGSFQTLRTDCRKHSSPNAGFPEAAVAGALGVQLGGSSSYFGVVKEKPTIGQDRREIKDSDIVTANRLNLVTAILFLIFMFVIKQLAQLL